MARLHGKTALITGAAGGIGSAMTRRFVAEGARVLAVDVDAERGQRLADEVGPACVFVAADHRRRDDDERLVEVAQDQFGGLDILCNNAAMLRTGAFESVSDEDLEIVLGSSLLGAWRLTQAALPLLRSSGELNSSGAAILFTASGMGLHGAAKFSAYAAAKHAIVGLMRSLALELGPLNIRVNALCPGVTDTPMVRLGSQGLGGVEQVLAGFAAGSPLRRASEPQDMAAAALFLVSDEARMVHSVALPVDGGHHGT